MKKLKRKSNEVKHAFLHTFFPLQWKQTYAEIKVNGFYLINQKNNKNKWEVAIYTPESYQKRKQFLLSNRSGIAEATL